MKAEVLTAKELAERLKMSVTWIRLKTYSGKIPCHKLGRAVRYVWSEVAKALGLPVEERDQGCKK